MSGEWCNDGARLRLWKLCGRCWNLNNGSLSTLSFWKKDWIDAQQWFGSISKVFSTSLSVWNPSLHGKLHSINPKEASRAYRIGQPEHESWVAQGIIQSMQALWAHPILTEFIWHHTRESRYTKVVFKGDYDIYFQLLPITTYVHCLLPERVRDRRTNHDEAFSRLTNGLEMSPRRPCK